jgi:predicted phosphodiesterase
MTRYALISDIHGNSSALIAVLNRIATLNVDRIICLGDVVGYGPEPERCMDLVTTTCDVCVRGNHDHGIIDPDISIAFNEVAQCALDMSRECLNSLHIQAIIDMPEFVELEPGILCTHETPSPGEHSYIQDAASAANAFQQSDCRIALVGHTHVPMLFSYDTTLNDSTVSPSDIIAHLPRHHTPLELNPDLRYIANPGSVGQPRDCDPRACFGVLDSDEWTFTIHREEYDIAAAQRIFHSVGLPSILADRLAVGA